MFHTDIVNVKIVQTEKDLFELEKKMRKAKYCFFDTETSGLRVRVADNDYMVGFTIAFEDEVDERVFYVPLRHEFEGEYVAGRIDEAFMNKQGLHLKDFKYFSENNFDELFEGDWKNIDPDEFYYLIKEHIEDDSKTWIAHNLSFDMHVLANDGIDIDLMMNDRKHNWDDTMGMSHTFNEEAEKKLEKIIEIQYHIKKTDYDDCVATVNSEEKKSVGLKGTQKATFNLVQIPIGAQYSGEDVWFMKQIYPDFIESLKEDEQWDVYRRMRIPFLKSLWKMERRGMKINEEKRAEMEEIAQAELDKMQYEMYEIAGIEFNINSGQQVAELLYGHKKKLKDKTTGGYKESFNEKIVEASFGFKPTHWTDGGKSKDKNLKNPQTNDDALQEILSQDYPKSKKKQEGKELVAILCEYNRLKKLHTAFIVGLKETMYQDGYVHPSFNQFGTDSHRLSCNDPNLQQLPKPLEKPYPPKEGIEDYEKAYKKYLKAKKVYDFWIRFEIRELFIPDDEEMCVIASDYKALEKRISTHFSEDPALIRMFTEGLDPHGLTATMVFPDELAGVHPNDVKKVRPDLRNIGKTVGFALDYGGSEFTISQNLGISKELARTYIDNYWEGFNGLAQWGDNQKRFARKFGYVLSLLGHKRHLSGIRSDDMRTRMYYERVSLNTSIQGTGADIASLAQVLVENDPTLKLLGFSLRMQVHDELVAVCPIKYKHICMDRLMYHMENCLPEQLLIPLECDSDWGMSYSEAK